MAKIGMFIDFHSRKVTSKITHHSYLCRGNGHLLLPLEGAKSQGEIPVVDGELLPGCSTHMMMVKHFYRTRSLSR